MTKNEEKKQKNKEILYSALRLQKHSKKSILAVMQSFAESTDSIDINSVDETKKFLEDLKNSLELCNDNICILEKLAKRIDNVSVWDSTSIVNYINSTEEINTNTPNNNTSETVSVNNEVPCEYKENTLIISETNGNVILPFELATLKQELVNSNNHYSSIDEIIKSEYSLPISLFKNPFMSRFREAYRLIRNREKGSVKEAFDLGLELMFNYNLHPAIISACKNIDELDVYLDYLDNGETSKFKYFKILFEIPPTVKKSSHEF